MHNATGQNKRYITMNAKKETLTIKSQGYAQAVAVDSIYAIAQWCLANISGFPVKADIDVKAREQLYAGYRLRRNEIFKPESSVTDGGKEIAVSVDIAYSYTSNEFGKLKESQPLLHKAVGEVRIATDKYCSQRYSRLLQTGVAILNEGKGRKPRAVKTVSEQCLSYCDSMEQKVKLHVGKEIENKAVLDKAILEITIFKNKIEEILKTIK